ncbi:MAG TPA: alpha/beta hydrolase [Acidimicrobiales bacterium]|jgi:pimeloyl-ACP methyl ester carboxylesterase|nr:alpha/beta hydrolase [Acidimicrobiales bacterium]
MSDDGYDEFGLFSENAAEAGLEWSGPPTVVRRSVEVDPGRTVSALVWGETPADLVLVHGGGQNAHTWDTVALALDRPLVAIDLPGHGHSDWPGDSRALDPAAMAADVTQVMTELAPESRALVGMSLGGMTAIAAAARHPELVPKLVLVDVTPGVNEKKSSDIAAFLAGPETFASFDEILERTIAFNPTRSESSLRRGVLHNAVQRDDGTWTWRHQLGRPSGSKGMHVDGLDFGSLWDDVSKTAMPLLLVRGGLSPVVDDDDVAELLRRRPDAEVIVVDNAGHSIQGDRPVELARILTEFLASS